MKELPKEQFTLLEQALHARSDQKRRAGYSNSYMCGYEQGHIDAGLDILSDPGRWNLEHSTQSFKDVMALAASFDLQNSLLKAENTRLREALGKIATRELTERQAYLTAKQALERIKG